MSEGGALVRFHDRRAARDLRAATIRLVAPAASGWWCLSRWVATLMLAASTSFFCTRRFTVAQNFGTGC